MASSVDKDPAAVEINIEGSLHDTPDAAAAAARTVAAPQPLDSDRRGRRLTAGAAANNAGNSSSANNGRTRSNSRSPSGRRAKRDTDQARIDAVPLLPGPNEASLPRPQPPTAGPEFDDDDSLGNGREFGPSDNRGIDSGFLEPIDNGAGSGGRDSSRGGRRGVGNPTPDSGFPNDRGFAPGFAPDGVVDRTTTGQIVPDMNVYQQKKNLAQGMMDLALLSANANQLRYVLESYNRHPYFYVNLTFITTSIIAQVAVGIGLIWKSRYNIKNQRDFCKADRINNFVTIGIFIITLVNVLISAFGVAEPRPAV